MRPAPARGWSGQVTFDWTIDITGIVSLALMFAAGVAAWVLLRQKVARLELDAAATRTEAAADVGRLAALVEMLQKRVEEIRAKGAHELAEFKLEVAKDYAGHPALREMEQRLVKAIDDLGRRIDAPARRRDL